MGNGRASVASAPSTRARNFQAILNALSTGEPRSTTELARALSAHLSTVTRALSVLQEADLVCEVLSPERDVTPSVGRAPRWWSLDPQAGFAIGLSLTNSVVRGALVDLTGRLVRSVERVFEPPLRREQLVSTSCDLAEALTRGPVRLRVEGIGIGVSGIVTPGVGEIAVSAGLLDRSDRSSMGYPLQAEVQEALGLPVVVANDANCAALAAFRRAVRTGAAAPDSSLYYILAVDSLWGFGSGIVLRGELHVGATGSAGETRHPDLRQAPPEWGDAPARALAGDEAAVGCVLEGLSPYVRHFAALALTLDTDRVVLGGALTRVGQPVLMALKDAAREAITYGDAVLQRTRQTMVLDDLWPDTVSLGAADLVLDALFPLPSLGECAPLVARAFAAEDAALQRERVAPTLTQGRGVRARR